MYAGQGRGRLGVGRHTTPTEGYERDFLYRGITFWTNELSLLRRRGVGPGREARDDANAEHPPPVAVPGAALATGPSGTETFAAGSLLATNLEAHMAGSGSFDVLFRALRAGLPGRLLPDPQPRAADHPRQRQEPHLRADATATEGWTREALPRVCRSSASSASGPVDSDESDEFFVTVTGFLTPSSLYHGTCRRRRAGAGSSPPPSSSTRGGSWSVSTRRCPRTAPGCPTSRCAAKDLPLDGSAPTLLYAYGGFEISLTPELQRVARRGLARAGRRLRAGEHPRRR